MTLLIVIAAVLAFNALFAGFILWRYWLEGRRARRSYVPGFSRDWGAELERERLPL